MMTLQTLDDFVADWRNWKSRRAGRRILRRKLRDAMLRDLKRKKSDESPGKYRLPNLQ